MAWRQLPDGSFFNPNTGDLNGLSGPREAAARALSAKMTGRLPPMRQNMFPPLPASKVVVLPGIKGPQAIIDPKRRLLGVNPYELGFGELSPMTKQIAMTGAIIAAVGVGCYAWNKLTSKRKK
jgi:hypothetical protein